MSQVIEAPVVQEGNAPGKAPGKKRGPKPKPKPENNSGGPVGSSGGKKRGPKPKPVVTQIPGKKRGPKPKSQVMRISSPPMNGNAAKVEMVDHPQHYGGDTVYEAIRVIEAHDLNFNLGSALKYLLRCGKKPGAKPVEDLEKACWYLQREIDRLNGSSVKSHA